MAPVVASSSRSPVESIDRAMSQRFRVMRQGNTVRILGALNDTSDISLLGDLCTSDVTLDLAGLVSATWAGLDRLYSFLQKSSYAFRLVGIPRNVYGYLRFLLRHDEKIAVENAEFDVFDPARLGRAADRCVLPISRLQALALEQGPILSIASDRQVLGLAEHICPRYFEGRNVAPRFTNPWCEDNPVQAAFWYNLCHTLSVSLRLGLDRIESGRYNMAPILAGIRSRLESLRKGLISTCGQSGVTDDEPALLALTHADAKLGRLVASFESVAGRFLNGSMAIQVACWSTQGQNPGTILITFENFARVLEAVDSSVPSFERARSIVSEFLMRDEVNALLPSRLRALTDDDKTPEALTELRETFNILNILSEGSWEDTIADVEAELVGLHQDFQAALVQLEQAVQGERILDRLMRSVALIEPSLGEIRADPSAWTKLRDRLFEQWRAQTSVSPEEIGVRAFYFPDDFSATDARGVAA